MNAVIEIEALNKSFRSKGFKKIIALDDVNLSVQAGEAFGFVGPNGAGKSTTIKILCGALNADSGIIRINGKNVANPISRCRMGYVPESPYLYDYLTPLEVLLAGCKIHRVNKPDLRAHCLSWLDRFGIAHVANRYIRTFSKGMTQRTALAHALSIEPTLLILDEPLSGLDPIGRKDVVDILSEYKHGGGTIFFSSHVLHDVERLADRYGLIHKGSLRTIRSPAELLGDNRQYLVRSIGELAIPGMLSEGDHRWKIEVHQIDLWPLLDAIRSHNHLIQEIRPALTLEKAFLEFLNIDNQSLEKAK